MGRKSQNTKDKYKRDATHAIWRFFPKTLFYLKDRHSHIMSCAILIGFTDIIVITGRKTYIPWASPSGNAKITSIIFWTTAQANSSEPGRQMPVETGTFLLPHLNQGHHLLLSRSQITGSRGSPCPEPNGVQISPSRDVLFYAWAVTERTVWPYLWHWY